MSNGTYVGVNGQTRIITTNIGPSGPPGPQGLPGSSLEFQGSVADYTDLPSSANLGDGYIEISSGHLFVWDGTSWVDSGEISGPQGAPGPQGESGGLGIPSGGTTNQVLGKESDTDFDVGWIDVSLSSMGEIDGGHASSVYLAEQIIDGGTA